METKSQKQNILEFMKKNPEGITPKDAWRICGCMRLASRINDLKKSGVAIASKLEYTEDGVRYSRYTIIRKK